MKFYLLILFALSFITIKSQNSKTVSYFDNAGNLADPENSLYFRTSTDTVNYYRSYYTKDSTLMFSGFILSAKDSSDKKNTYDGECHWYYSNKNKKLSCSFSKGAYDGLYIEYNESGKKVKSIDYVTGKIKGKQYTEYYSDHDSALIWSEDFNPASNAWEPDNASSKYKLGGVELTSVTRTHLINKDIFLKGSNYSIEAIINSNYLQGDLVGGLVFGYTDKDNYHYFFVDRFKFYVGEIIAGKDVKTIEGIYCKTLKLNSWNQLKVFFLNDKIELGINGEIQFIKQLASLKGNAGLGVKNAGSCIFDNFTFKKSSDSTYQRFSPSPFGNFSAPEGMTRIKNIAVGTILNKEGFILTALQAIPDPHTQIVIGAFVKDSLKWFNANIISKTENNNLLFLKADDLKIDSTTFIAPTFYNKDRVEIGTEIFTYMFDQNFQLKIKRPVIVAGKLETKARFENLLTFFECSIPMNQFTTGSPVFTKENELLGVVSVPSQTRNSRVIKATEVEKALFLFKKTIKKTVVTGKNVLLPNVILIITL